jgi:cation transporter-like permease
VITDRSAAVLAHDLGGSTDLPIPFTYALIGAAWALTFTFAVVALAWRRPRFDPDKPGRPLPRWVTTLGHGDRGAAVRGLGGDHRVVRPAGRA